MEQKLAYYEMKGQTAIVTIDHPPMNALDVATKEAIGEVFRELDDRRQEIRAVVLHGAGEKAFAAGADIKTFLELKPDTAKKRLSRSHQIYAMVENFEWPVIAAIHGFCLGAGLELALCCDIRCAEETAKLGFPEVNLSVFPGNGGIWRSLHHIPLGKLKELVFTGEAISATEAFRLGLIERVVPSRTGDGGRPGACSQDCRKRSFGSGRRKKGDQRGKRPFSPERIGTGIRPVGQSDDD